MLRLTECEHCGESLHSFMDELEDGQQLHVLVCPTCYQTILYPGVPSEQVAVSQRSNCSRYPVPLELQISTS